MAIEINIIFFESNRDTINSCFFDLSGWTIFLQLFSSIFIEGEAFIQKFDNFMTAKPTKSARIKYCTVNCELFLSDIVTF